MNSWLILQLEINWAKGRESSSSKKFASKPSVPCYSSSGFRPPRQLNSSPFPSGHISYARAWKEESFAGEESPYAAKWAVLQILITTLTGYRRGANLLGWDWNKLLPVGQTMFLLFCTLHAFQFASPCSPQSTNQNLIQAHFSTWSWKTNNYGLWKTPTSASTYMWDSGLNANQYLEDSKSLPPTCSASSSHLDSIDFSLHAFLKLSCRFSNRQIVVWLNSEPCTAASASPTLVWV